MLHSASLFITYLYTIRVIPGAWWRRVTPLPPAKQKLKNRNLKGADSPEEPTVLMSPHLR